MLKRLLIEQYEKILKSGLTSDLTIAIVDSWAGGRMYHQDEEVFVNVDDSWIKVSSVEAIKPTLSGKTRIYLTSGSFIDVGSASGHITPDDVMQYIVRAQTRP